MKMINIYENIGKSLNLPIHTAFQSLLPLDLTTYFSGFYVEVQGKNSYMLALSKVLNMFIVYIFQP